MKIRKTEPADPEEEEGEDEEDEDEVEEVVEKKVNKKVEEVSLVSIVKQEGMAAKLPDGTMLDLSDISPGLAGLLTWMAKSIYKIERNIAGN